jgi:hypothetical protein
VWNIYWSVEAVALVVSEQSLAEVAEAVFAQLLI